VVRAHPLRIYSAHFHDPYPNANGPLGLVPLLPMAALANALGWAANIGARAALAGAATSIVILLLAYQGVRLVAIARRGNAWSPTVVCSILLAPALWLGVIDYGHVEQPVELCLVVLAVGCVLRAQSMRAGVALGAAVLTRTIAAFSVIPFALVPLANRRLRPAAVMLAASVATVGGVLAPFVLTNEPAVAHSLLGYRSRLPIGGGSFWVVAHQTSFRALGQYGYVYLAVAAAFSLVAIIVWRRPATATSPAGLMGLLTVATACFPLFAKTVFPYYLAEPYVFSALWWLARPGSARNWRVVVPLLITADVFLAKAGTTLFTGTSWVAEGISSSAIIAATAALVILDLFRSSTAVQHDHMVALG
jgi:hypothetical protein